MSAKSGVRNAMAHILAATGMTAPRRRGHGRLSVATFHRVLPEAERKTYPYPGLAVTPEELGQFLAFFSEHFDCGTLAAQHRRCGTGEPTERPLLAITFDDGQYDNHRHARPVLRQHGIMASFFIPVVAVEKGELLWHDRLGFSLLGLQKRGADERRRLAAILGALGLDGGGPGSLVENVVGASKKLCLADRLRLVASLDEAAGGEGAPEFARLMTFAEIAELAVEGHEIGSHSMTHCLMPECDDNALAYEMAESRRILAARLGRDIETFCYPNGDCDARTARAAAAAGYRRAVTTAWGSNDASADAFRLRRCDMDAARVFDGDGRLQQSLLAWRMSGLYPGLA